MIIQGIAHWAKIVGKPQPGYDKSKKEWSLDLEINDEVKKQLVDLGLKAKIKEHDDGYKYITFKRPAVRSDGTEAKPIRIVDHKKAEWDGKTLIGNGSVVNVSFVVNETEYQGKTFKKPGIISVQVVKLVPYESKGEDFPEYNEEGAEDWSQDD